MNDILRIPLVLLVCAITFHSFGQENQKKEFQNPPVNVEALVGSRGISFQMIIDKKIESLPQLGFFSVIDMNSDWSEKKTDDLMVQANLTLELAKGFRLYGGFHHTVVTGLRPSAGLIYSFVNQKWTIILAPRIDLQKDPNIEGIALVEFKPKLNENWRMYFRVQALYSYMTEIEDHGRSYIRSRAGLSYKEISFGAGANIEYYGPMKQNENNIGFFTNVLLF
ncbi:hypothetical protein GKZ90_0006340 [Flavobacterium sp. MC2016-06]|jgi:hypothetical protein|uniref:hypothetical protein n=1 Tax=Flavobacterium sp. MC2016-06 TaxID=2676308 RepID=UPI0012BB1AD3|nr:hypothetical protein [Flavobacterium sp. MC2016-06]MBU3857757.1 hypothetical protein [Flavobacterium sp. MC2016-06]